MTAAAANDLAHDVVEPGGAGPDRLADRIRHALIAAGSDQLLDVERDAVAAFVDRIDQLGGRHGAQQRLGEAERPGPVEPGQADLLGEALLQQDRPARWTAPTRT
jgi:hypothetical protein